MSRPARLPLVADQVSPAVTLAAMARQVFFLTSCASPLGRGPTGGQNGLARSGPTGGQNGLARPFRTIRSPSEPSRSIRYCPSISTTLDRYGRFSMDSRNSKNGALLTT